MENIYDEKKKGLFSKPSEIDFKKIKEKKEVCLYSSMFDFLKDQNGWRPGDIHVVMGMESSGKTSLVRSLILEAGYHLPVLLYCSEETTEDTWYELNRSYERLISNNLATPMDNPLDYISILYEEDLTELVSNYKDVITYIRNKLIETKAGLFVIDNPTTSQFYDDLTPKEQKSFARAIKALGKELGVPVLLVVHTRKDYTGRGLMRSGDVRGNNVIAMMAEHFYCFNSRVVYNTTTGKDEIRVVLNVTKLRGVDREDLFYAMRYNKNTRLYDKSVAINSKMARDFIVSSKPIGEGEDSEDRSSIFQTRKEKEKAKIDDDALLASIL